LDTHAVQPVYAGVHSLSSPQCECREEVRGVNSKPSRYDRELGRLKPAKYIKEGLTRQYTPKSWNAGD